MAKLGDPADRPLPQTLEEASEREVQAEIEEQVRSWSTRLEFSERIHQNAASLDFGDEILPYITVSRETGAGGSQVIQHIAKTLAFEIVDRELLDYLAERYQLPRDMLELVDERVANWLTEALGMWLAHRMVSQSDYLLLLGRFVLMAAHNANAIFAGRGVQFTLPRERGLAVRIVAPLEQRIRRIMERQYLSRDGAKRYIAKRDAGRRDFVRCHFQQDVNNPVLYDLVINTENISFENAADIVVAEWRNRFGS